MGLDNMPREYPCKTQGTAVLDEDGTILCDDTQAGLGCPLVNAPRPDGLVLGMFGTACWFRGKVGQALLSMADGGDDDVWADGSWPHNGFFGPDDDGLDPQQCHELADWMAERGEVFIARVNELYPGDDPAQTIKTFEYAVWWLRWTADHGQGAAAWW